VPRGYLQGATSIGPDPSVPSREGLSGLVNWLASWLAPVYPEQEVGPLDLLAAVPPLKGLKAFATLGKAADAADVVGDVGRGIRAYHGSPHDFEQFALSKIGTGEGAQAYGHGLYFAENEGVARSYRDALAIQHGLNAPRQLVSAGGVTVADMPSYQALSDPAKRHVQSALSLGADRQKALSNLDYQLTMMQKQRARGLPGYDKAEDFNAEARRFIEALPELTHAPRNPGHMYEVDINAHFEDFLDWDKPLSEQSEKVRTALAEAWHAHPETHAHMTGAQIYDEVVKTAARHGAANPEAVAADMLRVDRIPGVKYLDEGSRTSGTVNKFGDNWFIKGSSTPYPTRVAAEAAAKAAGQRTHNYVVFDDALVSILRKYGLLPPVAALGLSQLGRPQSETR
jgi:hypothetical protein